jgi:hypothetical protein
MVDELDDLLVGRKGKNLSLDEIRIRMHNTVLVY